jgi:hypothetical protein
MWEAMDTHVGRVGQSRLEHREAQAEELPPAVRVDAPPEGCAVAAAVVREYTTHDLAYRLSYSSWRRHQISSSPSSFLPHGARSRKRYVPIKASVPRA